MDWKERLGDPAFWVLLGNFLSGVFLLFGINPDTTSKIIGAIMSLGSLAIFVIKGAIVEIAKARIEVARIRENILRLEEKRGNA